MVIDLVKADDWQGLYINGVLVEETHCIQTEDLLEYVKLEVIKSGGISEFEYVVSYVNSEWMEEYGSLPQLIKDIPEEEIEI